MIDAYTHLDLSVTDPVADFQARMSSAGVTKALAVEMWSGANLSLLERIADSHLRQFSVAPCFRPETGAPGLDFLAKSDVVALRVKTSDLSRLGGVATWLERSQKSLVAHADSGIAAFVNELIALRQKHPGLRAYVPHLGWPRQDGIDDPQWAESMTALSRLPGVIVCVSAIAHFSREAFPHPDVRTFVSRLAELFPPESIITGSDYPLS